VRSLAQFKRGLTLIVRLHRLVKLPARQEPSLSAQYAQYPDDISVDGEDDPEYIWA
jgi:hypothetical protein